MIPEKPKACQCLSPPLLGSPPRRDYNTGPASQAAGHDARFNVFQERIT
jgi:hypothetical protein